MRYATFLNFTGKPFTAYWNGRPYTFQPGQKKEHLNESIAEHFAKHLANQVLTEKGKEQYCSPKRPADVPQFMEVFNKAFIIESDGQEFDAETGLSIDGNGRQEQPDEIGMNVRVKPAIPIGRTIDPYDANSQTQLGPDEKPQIIGTAEEDAFEGNK